MPTRAVNLTLIIINHEPYFALLQAWEVVLMSIAVLQSLGSRNTGAAQGIQIS